MRGWHVPYYKMKSLAILYVKNIVERFALFYSESLPSDLLQIKKTIDLETVVLQISILLHKGFPRHSFSCSFSGISVQDLVANYFFVTYCHGPEK